MQRGYKTVAIIMKHESGRDFDSFVNTISFMPIIRMWRFAKNVS